MMNADKLRTGAARPRSLRRILLTLLAAFFCLAAAMPAASAQELTYGYRNAASSYPKPTDYRVHHSASAEGLPAKKATPHSLSSSAVLSAGVKPASSRELLQVEHAGSVQPRSSSAPHAAAQAPPKSHISKSSEHNAPINFSYHAPQENHGGPGASKGRR